MADWRDSLAELRNQLETYQASQKTLLEFYEFLHELDRHIAAAEGALDQVVPFALEELGKFVTADVIEFLMPDGPDLVIRFSTDPTGVGQRVPINHSVTGKAVLTGRPVNIADISHDTNTQLYHLVYPEMQSELAYPVKESGLSLAVLNLESKVRYAFNGETERLLKMVGGQVAIAVRDAVNLRFHAAAENLTTRLMSGNLSLEGAFAAILEDALSHIGKPAGVVGQLLLFNVDTLELIYGTDTGANRLAIDPANSISGYALQKREAVNIPDLTLASSEISSKYAAVAKGMRSELAVPLITATGEAVGVLNLESPSAGAFTDRQKDIAIMYAKQAASAVAWARQRQAYDTALRRNESTAAVATFGLVRAELLHGVGGAAGYIKVACQNIEREGKDCAPSPSLWREVEKIFKNATAITELVAQLGQDPRMANERETIQLDTLLSAAVKAVGVEPDIELVPAPADWQNLAPDLPPVRVSPLLRDVFGNLLTNAVRSIGRKRGGLSGAALEAYKGRIIVSIAIVKGLYSRRREAIEVRITDNGSGIDPQDKDRIYELGRQGDGAEVGFGLGLWWVRTVLDLHDAQITHESTVGEGATFIVRLPYSVVALTENGMAPT